jgi:hypothetical protein
VQPDAKPGEIELLEAEPCNLLYTSASVVEDEDERAIAKRSSAARGQLPHQRLDRVALKERHLGPAGAFARNRCDSLTDSEQVRNLSRNVVEEDVQSGEALIARLRSIAAGIFELSKNAKTREGEIVEREPRDLAFLVGGDEQQEEAHRISVAVDRRGPETLDRHQVMGKEAMDNFPELRAHGVPPGSAKPATTTERDPAPVCSSSGSPATWPGAVLPPDIFMLQKADISMLRLHEDLATPALCGRARGYRPRTAVEGIRPRHISAAAT